MNSSHFRRTEPGYQESVFYGFSSFTVDIMFIRLSSSTSVSNFFQSRNPYLKHHWQFQGLQYIWIAHFWTLANPTNSP